MDLGCSHCGSARLPLRKLRMAQKSTLMVTYRHTSAPGNCRWYCAVGWESVPFVAVSPVLLDQSRPGRARLPLRQSQNSSSS